MTAHEFIQIRPRLFHFTAAGAWITLRQHGLLTTASLLEMTHLDSEEKRRDVAQQRRCGNITLEVSELGRVVIRDQIPLHPAGLRKALPDGYEPQHWIDLLNDRVFLWTRKEDCMKLLDARFCRGTGTLLELDASSLITTYEADIELTTFNVGYTLRKPKARSPASFVPFASYPAKEIKKIRELTVKRSVKDLEKHVVDVTEWNETVGSTYTQ